MTLPTRVAPEDYLNRSVDWVIDRGARRGVDPLPRAWPRQFRPDEPLRAGIEVVVATLIDDESCWVLIVKKPSIRQEVTLPQRIAPEEYLSRSMNWVIDRGIGGSVEPLPQAWPYAAREEYKPKWPVPRPVGGPIPGRFRTRRRRR